MPNKSHYGRIWFTADTSFRVYTQNFISMMVIERSNKSNGAGLVKGLCIYQDRLLKIKVHVFEIAKILSNQGYVGKTQFSQQSDLCVCGGLRTSTIFLLHNFSWNDTTFSHNYLVSMRRKYERTYSKFCDHWILRVDSAHKNVKKARKFFISAKPQLVTVPHP